MIIQWAGTFLAVLIVVAAVWFLRRGAVRGERHRNFSNRASLAIFLASATPVFGATYLFLLMSRSGDQGYGYLALALLIIIPAVLVIAVLVVMMLASRRGQENLK